MSTWEIDDQGKMNTSPRRHIAPPFIGNPSCLEEHCYWWTLLQSPCFCPQVHPECDPGAGHHSGQKPRAASSVHHAGYRCDAEAGEPHAFQEVISQDLNLKLPWLVYHNLAGAWKWQALFQAREVWARNTDCQGRSPDISLRVLQETQTAWENGCVRGNRLEAREVAWRMERSGFEAV